MRIGLFVHGLPPRATHGVETHTQAFAEALARAGFAVEVFAPCNSPGRAQYSQRREVRAEGYGVTWVQVEGTMDPRHMARAVGAFLDRERPDVVHLQHMIQLGAAAIEEVERRGIPLVYTAHDFFPVHQTLTLMRPDLVPFECGDLEMQARVLQAQGFLDKLNHLGDHHGTVLLDQPGFENQIGEASAVTLRAILDGQRDGGLAEAREQVRLRAQHMRVTFAKIDKRVATSQVLARRLGGALGRAVEFRASGIPTDHLSNLSAARSHGGPLRIGFIGGLLKHKGVHTLLEAFGPLQGEAELHIHGASHDRAYGRILRARAAEVGAQMHGEYSRDQLPQILGGLDLLVVPSLWMENAPYVIREAFAARRPVLVSDTEALRESVRDGEDGLLFTQGDPKALRVALRRLIDEEGLFERLVMGITPPLSIDEEAQAYGQTYSELLEKARENKALPLLPASVEPFAERFAALDALPTRDIFERVQRGLEKLGECMGVAEQPADLLTQAVASGSPTRDLLLDHDRALEWLRKSVANMELARDEMEKRAGWFQEQLANAEKRAQWLGGQVDQGAKTTGVERDWLKESKDDLEQERDWLREQQGESEQANSWLRESLDQAEQEGQRLRAWAEDSIQKATEEAEKAKAAAKAAAEEAQKSQEWTAESRQQTAEEAEWLKETAEELRRENRWLQEKADDGEAAITSAQASAAEATRALAALAKEREWMRGVLETRQQELRWVRERLTGDSVPEGEDPAKDPAAIFEAHEALERELVAMHSHEHWLYAELASIAGILESKGSEAKTLAADQLPAALAGMRAAAARSMGELTWRRQEMLAAREGSDRLLARLASPELADRIRSWELSPEPSAPLPPLMDPEWTGPGPEDSKRAESKVDDAEGLHWSAPDGILNDEEDES